MSITLLTADQNETRAQTLSLFPRKPTSLLTGLTGGGALNLDGIDVANFSVGDRIALSISGVGYSYTLTTSGAAESSPLIIAPDSGGSGLRWMLDSITVNRLVATVDSSFMGSADFTGGVVVLGAPALPTAWVGADGIGIDGGTGTSTRRLFIGDGSGYKLVLSSRTGSVTTDAISLFDNGNISSIGVNIESIDTRNGAGAISVTKTTTQLTTTGANALTLADGINGQIKRIVMVVDAGDGTLTPTTKTGFTTIVFGDVGDSVTLQFYTTLGWMVISNNGCVIS